MKSRPVLITFSVLAALDVLTAGAILGDVIGAQTAALLVLGTKAVQAGMAFYVQGQVVPQQDVGAYVNSAGEMVAGPAGGVTNGQKVQIGTNAAA